MYVYATNVAPNISGYSPAPLITAIERASGLPAAAYNPGDIFTYRYIKIEPAPIPTVTSVTVNPATVEVTKGGTKSFTATVTGTNNPTQTVTWNVTGGVTGTSIDADGVLTVAADETATTLTIKATSTVDTSKNGTSTVTVTVNTVSVTISGAIFKVTNVDAGSSYTVPENIYAVNAQGNRVTDVAETSELTALIAITSAQPNLGSSISMIYTANIQTSLIGVNTPQMVFTFNNKIYPVNGVAGTEVEGYTPYTFCFTNIAPQCMGDVIDATLAIDGKAVTKNGYSMKIYCDTMLAKSDSELTELLSGNTTATVSELKTLLGDILLYGAASQVYTGYKSNALVSNLDILSFTQLTETDKVVTVMNSENAYFTAAGLWFENINKIYWKIAVSDENLSKLSVQVYRDGEETPCGTELTKISDGVYIVYSEDIAAASFGTEYTAVMTYDGTETQSVTYSVNSYVYAKQGKATPIGTLVKALCNYGTSAVAYMAE